MIASDQSNLNNVGTKAFSPNENSTSQWRNGLEFVVLYRATIEFSMFYLGLIVVVELMGVMLFSGRSA